MVRKPRTDGFYSVYIRIVHNRKPGYIKTDKIVDAAHITSNGELTDPLSTSIVQCLSDNILTV